MGQQVRGTFQWRLSVIWIAVVVLFIGIVPQLRADEHAAPNENGWVQTNGPYGGEMLAIYAAPKGVLFAGTEGAGIFRSTDRGNSWIPAQYWITLRTRGGFYGCYGICTKGRYLSMLAHATYFVCVNRCRGNTWQSRSKFPKP